MRRLNTAVIAILAVATIVAGTVQPAQALTIRDVVELSRAGLTDDVLVALIEVDGGIYPTDTATLKSLKDAGVSDRVMIALIRSGRERRVEEPPAPAPIPTQINDEAAVVPPPPPTIVIEHREVRYEPQVQQVAVPVYIPVYPARGHVRRSEPFTGIQESTFVPLQPGVVRPRPEHETKPVYWGFGGKLRPDAWGQPQASDKKPSDAGDGKDGDRDRGDRNRSGRR